MARTNARAGAFTLKSSRHIEALDDSHIFLSWTGVRSPQLWEVAYHNNLARTRQFDRDDSYRHVTGDRKDKSPQYRLALIYKMRRSLRWKPGWTSMRGYSAVASYNYRQSIA